MANCAGCGKDHTQFPCYTDPESEPVTADGSYADGKFVCDDCYIVLILHRQDVGSPKQLQDRARLLIAK